MLDKGKLSTRGMLAGIVAVVVTLSLVGVVYARFRQGPSQATDTDKHLILATDFPISGGDATATLPAQYAVNLAVAQHVTLPHGYTLAVQNDDDEGTSGGSASRGMANVQALIQNPQVVAIVGPFNSGVAAAEIPVINDAGGPVLISPTNTNPGLTLSQYATLYGFDYNTLHPAGKPDFYFRIPASDVSQGAADAQIALSPQLGNLTSAYVVDDSTLYGVGLADFFASSFQQGGGTIANDIRSHLTYSTLSSLPQLAVMIKSSGAQLVFYGGVRSQGGCKLKAALGAVGFKGPLVGGDGIADDPGCLADAGEAAAGITATVAAPDPAALTSSAAQTFVSQFDSYISGQPDAALLPYSAQAYDAAMIEITAITNVINSGHVVTGSAGRLNVRNAVAGITYHGVTGTIAFDANGDNDGSKVFSVYAILPAQPLKWSFIRTIDLA